MSLEVRISNMSKHFPGKEVVVGPGQYSIHRLGQLVVIEGENIGAYVNGEQYYDENFESPEKVIIDTNRGVSGRHLGLEISKEKVYLWDDESRNGTFLDGEKIEKYTPIELPLGNYDLRLGPGNSMPLTVVVAID